jgi:NAD(P)-dependent dehydrogenase (short-subunit alcohol dehydrogenase family)
MTPNLGFVLVTGAAGMLGQAIRAWLTTRGIPVVGLDLHAAPTEDILACDITDSAAVDTVVAAVMRRGPISGLVNNAGVMPPLAPALEASENDFSQTYAVHVLGSFLCARAVARGMPAGGSIVNIGSLAGQIGSTTNIPYSVSKAAVHTLTVCLARALAPQGIRVNTVAPGLIWTDMWIRMARTLAPADPQGFFAARAAQWTLLGQPQTAADIAAAVGFLLSPQAAAITGQILPVDGGATHGRR